MLASLVQAPQRVFLPDGKARFFFSRPLLPFEIASTRNFYLRRKPKPLNCQE
jgi:hypothetical protein